MNGLFFAPSFPGDFIPMALEIDKKEEKKSTASSQKC